MIMNLNVLSVSAKSTDSLADIEAESIAIDPLADTAIDIIDISQEGYSNGTYVKYLTDEEAKKNVQNCIKK